MAFNPPDTLGKEVGPSALDSVLLGNYDPALLAANHATQHEAPASFYTVTANLSNPGADAATSEFSFVMPWKARLWHLSGNAKAITATSGTFDIKDDGTSVLDVTDGSFQITGAALTKEVKDSGTGVVRIDKTKRDIASGSVVKCVLTQAGAGAITDPGLVLTFQRL